MINLLPPKRVLDIKTARSNTVLRRYVELILLSMALLVVVVIVAYYFFDIQKNNTKHTVDINQEKIAKLEPVQSQAQQLSATVNTISGLLSRNVKFSDMLTQIGGLMPSGSVLTGLQFSIEDVESPLVISAQVDNEQKAAVLRNNIASSKLFDKAEIKSISQIEEKATTQTTTPTTTDKTVPTLTHSTPTTTSNPYKFTTVINAYFKKGILGVVKK
jgi:hypothetical protein